MSSIFGPTLVAATKKLATGAAAVVAAGAGAAKGEFFPQQPITSIRHQVSVRQNMQDIEQEDEKNTSDANRSVEIQIPLAKKTSSWTRLSSPDLPGDDFSVDSAISSISYDSDSDPLLRHGLEVLCGSMMKSFVDQPVSQLEGECAKEALLNNPAMMQKTPILKHVATQDLARQEELFDEAIQLLQNQKLIEDFHHRMLSKQAALLNQQQKKDQQVVVENQQAEEQLQQTELEIVAEVKKETATKVATVAVTTPTSSALFQVASWAALQDQFKCVICQDVLAGPVILSCECTSFCFDCIASYKSSFSSTSSNVATHYPCPHCKQVVEQLDPRYERALDDVIFSAIQSLSGVDDSLKQDWAERRQACLDYQAAQQEADRKRKVQQAEEEAERVQEEQEWEEWKSYALPVVTFCMLALIAVYRVSAGRF